MTAAEKRQAARDRIDATKRLTLDERIAIVDSIDAELNIGLSGMAQNHLETEPQDRRRVYTKCGQQVTHELIRRGYEPMMFSAACNIVISRRV